MDDVRSAELTGVGALEHLTGPSRGCVTWLSAHSTDIALTPAKRVHCSETRSGLAPDGLIARFRRAGDAFELTAASGQSVWVNGAPVAAKRLVSGDVIELGEDGPLSRFRLYREGSPAHEGIAEILSDTLAYVRVSRQPLGRRLGRAAGGIARRLISETTLLFRAGVIVAILALAGVLYQQNQLSQQLRSQVDSSAAQLERFAAALLQARNEALTPEDLRVLGREIGQQITSNAERLAALEQRSTASARVITESLASVAFLQGAYGFKEAASGRFLRHVLGPDGKPIRGRNGQPMLTLESDGPVAEAQYTGTGFVIGTNGFVVTNRHVALPWETEAAAAALAEQGLQPAMLRLIAYFPGGGEAVPVALGATSDAADLAILVVEGEAALPPGLPLADGGVNAGDEVLVMGYPTGLRSMLAQSGDAFIETLEQSEDTDFWRIAERLAADGLIAPLASRGIVGQATDAAIVYDADTTHGGSGGPVLDVDGNVVAVNAAILPEYGGSNLGVPAAQVKALLASAKLER